MGLGHHVFAITQKTIECSRQYTIYYTTIDRLNNAILVWHEVLQDQKHKEAQKKRKRVEEIDKMDKANTAKEPPDEVEEIIKPDFFGERAPTFERIARGSTDVDGTKATEAEGTKVKRRKGRPPRRVKPAGRAATKNFRLLRPAPEREMFPNTKAESAGKMQLSFIIQSAHSDPKSQNDHLITQQPSETNPPNRLETTKGFRTPPPPISSILNTLGRSPGPVNLPGLRQEEEREQASGLRDWYPPLGSNIEESYSIVRQPEVTKERMPHVSVLKRDPFPSPRILSPGRALIALPRIAHGFRLGPAPQARVMLEKGVRMSDSDRPRLKFHHHPLNLEKRIPHTTVDQPGGMAPEARIMADKEVKRRESNQPDLEVRHRPFDPRNENSHFTDYQCHGTGVIGSVGAFHHGLQAPTPRKQDATKTLNVPSTVVNQAHSPRTEGFGVIKEGSHSTSFRTLDPTRGFKTPLPAAIQSRGPWYTRAEGSPHSTAINGRSRDTDFETQDMEKGLKISFSPINQPTASLPSGTGGMVHINAADNDPQSAKSTTQAVTRGFNSPWTHVDQSNAPKREMARTDIVDKASQRINLTAPDTTQGFGILVPAGRPSIGPRLKHPMKALVSQETNVEKGHPSPSVGHRPHRAGDVQPTIYRTVKVPAPDFWELKQYAMSNGIPIIDEDARVLEKESENQEDVRKEQVKIRGLARHEHAIMACWILQQGQRPRMLWQCNECGAKGGI
ncbi:MAG: hypothetical protein LQ337_003782 [Flavoplaca oasis]|nr:MAG: hypothetical protein LQ337_003782 [Flavoplaca oasis]